MADQIASLRPARRAGARPALPEAQPIADVAARDGGQVAMIFERFAKSIGTYF